MQTLDGHMSPVEALRHWPEGRPLAALVTSTADARWGRWSMLAQPERTIAAHTAEDALRAIEHAANDGGTWIVALSYELGAAFEPRALPRHRAPSDGWPLATLVRCGPSLEFRLEEGGQQWSWGLPTHGDGTHADAAHLAAEIIARAGSGTHAAERASITGLDADITRADYERMVARAVELVRAGDIFQANIAQRFSARWTGSPRAVMRAALQAATPRYGAYLETPTHALVGMSPELFLDVDRRAGTAVTRPIKGTRAFHEDPAELMASAKEAAELHMIVDLMRNDLGRIAVAGGVRVDASRALESHATVHHCVAEISARLRPGITATEILRATFPPGSVTGAPKVRAMQVIDELEPCARGPYCGAVGLISPERIALNVSIRTIAMAREGADGGVLRYGAGCGIVAESEPRNEYEESLHKSAVLLRTAHMLGNLGNTAGSGAGAGTGISATGAARAS